MNVDQPPSTEAVITSLLLVHTHTVFALAAAAAWRNPARALLPTRFDKLLLFKLVRTITPAITNKIVHYGSYPSKGHQILDPNLNAMTLW